MDHHRTTNKKDVTGPSLFRCVDNMVTVKGVKCSAFRILIVHYMSP